jgi:L-alanine-DL-glutamate epimerase-like enolase superfamily enzyme
MRLARACEEAGMPLELHVGNIYHLQVMGATSEHLIEYYETFTASREIRTRPGRVTPEPVADADGCMPVPQTPGMGVEADWKYIHSHKAD